MSTPTGLLTGSVTAARLGIDRSTLSRWVSKGRITPADKLPGLRGAFLFDPKEVDRVAADQDHAGAGPSQTTDGVSPVAVGGEEVVGSSPVADHLLESRGLS